MLNEHTKKIIYQTMCDSVTLKKAIYIALIVGTILNVINQGDYIFHMAFDKINFYKLVLTYFVPFFVSTYTAVNMNMRLKIREKAIISSNLRCKRCKSTLHVEKNEIIPECPKCGLQGIWKAVK